VEAAPLVRSSYHAGEQVRALSVVHRKLYGDAAMREHAVPSRLSAVSTK
jgi:hypothetical protein